MTLYFAGADPAINHAALVVLYGSGSINQINFLTTKKTYAARYDRYADFLPIDTSEDTHVRNLLRLTHVEEWWERVALLNEPSRSVYAAVEDYALGQARRAHQIGEAGWCCRRAFLKAGVPFRLHDPGSVKIFATGKGTADKEQMKAAYAGTDYETWIVEKFPKLPKEVEEDIYDALTLARMCRTEFLLRRGDVSLKDLDEKERRAFNRVTKANPVNILGREWITSC